MTAIETTTDDPPVILESTSALLSIRIDLLNATKPLIQGDPVLVQTLPALANVPVDETRWVTIKSPIVFIRPIGFTDAVTPVIVPASAALRIHSDGLQNSLQVDAGATDIPTVLNLQIQGQTTSAGVVSRWPMLLKIVRLAPTAPVAPNALQ